MSTRTPETRVEQGSQPDSIFVEVPPDDLKKIEKKRYAVKPGEDGITLSIPPKNSGRAVSISDACYEKLKAIRRHLRSLGGSPAAGEILGKTGNAITLADAAEFAILTCSSHFSGSHEDILPATLPLPLCEPASERAAPPRDVPNAAPPPATPPPPLPTLKRPKTPPRFY